MDEPCPDCGGTALYGMKHKTWGPIHDCDPDFDEVFPLAGKIIRDLAGQEESGN